jgi:uncharacterized protein (TIGR03086 family)
VDIVEIDGRALHGLEKLVAGVTPQQRAAATPCTEWTVEDLLVHIVAVNRKYAGVGRGDPWEPGATDIDRGDDPVSAYSETIAPLLEAWRRPGALQRTLDLPVGERPAELALWVHLREILVHGWDLAVSTGQRSPFDDDVVEACLASTRDMGTPATRPAGVGFADAVPAPQDAEPIVRLAAFFGRDVSAWS